MSDLTKIDTIIIVMLENRSFDHILGHLSLQQYGNGTTVNGLKEPLNSDQYENDYQAQPYYPFPMRDGVLPTDLPHERDFVATQLAKSAINSGYDMDGFVKAYFDSEKISRTTTPVPMGFLRPEDIPISRFFADNYTVCDQWHASLPASTQPNRMMALAGDTYIDTTSGILPPTPPISLDWLDKHNVKWRVYHCGISFFALLGRIEIFGENFRSIDRLAADIAHESNDDFPKVIFIEPSYADAPHIGGDLPNDNHPPLPVCRGEAFLKQVYDAVTCNPDRWQKTMMIVTYDEHGGFFDHVSPPLIPYVPSKQATFTKPFDSLGVRVPAFIVSPFVSSKGVYSGLLDHTSILQLFAEKYAPQESGYSKTVMSRRSSGIGSVSQILNLNDPRTDIPRSPAAPLQIETLYDSVPTDPSAMQQAFQASAKWMVDNHPKETAQKYPDVSHWVLTTGKKDIPIDPA
jgi:phospholipase C